MARWALSERRLASGPTARVLRIDAERFAVRPFFREAPPEDEMGLACILAEARLGAEMAAVPPADIRLGAPLDLADGAVCLAARSAPTMGLRAAPMRLIRTAAASLAPDELLINANYFLFQAVELTRPWDAYGDPIGLTLCQGVVETPPQLPRSCLVASGGMPAIRRLSFADVTLTTADGAVYSAHPFGPPHAVGPGMAVALFHGSEGGCAPAADGEWDVAFVGRHPVAFGPAGFAVPRAGCVLRCASRADAEAVAAGPLSYGLGDVSEGVQTGPLIVEGGAVTTRDIFVEEVMANDPNLPDQVLISPDRWRPDWHETRAARLSAGIDGAGRLFFCAVEGTSSFLTEGRAEGATLHDLAVLMVEEGADMALHLDGGGSTQAFCAGGGALIQSRDIHHGMRDSPAQFDRPVPLALHLS